VQQSDFKVAGTSLTITFTHFLGFESAPEYTASLWPIKLVAFESVPDKMEGKNMLRHKFLKNLVLEIRESYLSLIKFSPGNSSMKTKLSSKLIPNSTNKIQNAMIATY